MPKSKKIIVDLDVVTLAFWDKKDEARLIERIKANEFEMVCPYIILNHLLRWDYKKLAEEIREFYEKYSSGILTAKILLEKTEEVNVEYYELLDELISIGVKEEDVVLVIISSLFNIDYLITFNRKHLKNKEKEIGEVLEKYGIKSIKIKTPSEV